MQLFTFMICTGLALTVFAGPSSEVEKKQSKAENKSQAKSSSKKEQPKEELALRSFEQLKQDSLNPQDPNEKNWKELNAKAETEKAYTPPSQTEQWRKMEQDRPGELPEGFRDPITNQPNQQFLMDTKSGLGY